MRWARIFVVGTLGAALAFAMSCREPTEVFVEVRTNVPYRGGIVTAFVVGAPGTVEDRDSTTETNEPWGDDGFVGSLGVIPPGSKDARVAIKVVMGVNREPRGCLTDGVREGCIVARRVLQYRPGERVRLPITLYAQCEGVACEANSTCNYLGICVSSEIDPESCSSPDGCVLPGERNAPPLGAPPDGAAPEDGASSDADTGPPPSGDAQPEGGDAGLPGTTNLCPVTPVPVDCSVVAGGPICCNTLDGTFQCRKEGSGGGAEGCNGAGVYAYSCTGRQHCSANQFCCASTLVAGIYPRAICSACTLINANILCRTNGDCPLGSACTGLYAPDDGARAGQFVSACQPL